MPPIYNVGKDIIEAYLQGVAVRQQREDRIARMMQMQQQADLAQQRIDQQLKIATEAEKGRNERAKLTREIQEKNVLLRSLVTKQQLAKAIQDRNLEMIDPSLGFEDEEGNVRYNNFRVAPQGAALAQEVDKATQIAQARGKVSVQTEVDKMLQTEPLKLSLERGIQSARAPFLAQLREQSGRIAAEAREDTQRHQKQIQAERLAAALERTKLTGRETKEEKTQIILDAIDTAEPEIRTGNLTAEDINKRAGTGEAKLKIFNGLKARGLVPLHDSDRDDMRLLSQAQNFLDKLRAIRDKANSFPDPRRAAIDPAYQELVREARQDLDAWGRAVKGFKGQVTERDTARLEGGMPGAFPAGIFSSLSKANEIKAANNRRVEAVEDFIQEKFNLVTGQTGKGQRESIRERYGIMPPPFREKKKSQSVPQTQAPTARPSKINPNWQRIE